MSWFSEHIRQICEMPAELVTGLARKLDSALAAQPDLWEVYDRQKPNRFSPFKDTTQHIVFGFPTSTRQYKEFLRYEHWQDWAPAIQPIIDFIAPYYGYTSGQTNRIMLANMLPGAVIDRHVDGDPSAAIPHKIHVPLTTNPGVEFWIEDAIYHLKVGHAYEVNNRVMHGGQNQSATEARVHLIFDYFDEKILERDIYVRPPRAQFDVDAIEVEPALAPLVRWVADQKGFFFLEDGPGTDPAQKARLYQSLVERELLQKL